MMVSNRWFLSSVLVAMIGSTILPAGAADPPPQQRPCRELTGEERTRCEQQARKAEPSPPRKSDEPERYPPRADEKEPPPPDTHSESDEQSDTADPPQA